MSEEVCGAELDAERRTYAIGKLYMIRKSSGGTARGIAQETGVSKNTVLRCEEFARAVDLGEEESPGFREKVLSGDVDLPKKAIRFLNEVAPEERKNAVQAILNGEAPKQKESAEIQSIGSSEYTADDFISQINEFPKELDSSIRLFLMAHGDMMKDKKCKEGFAAMLGKVEAVVKKYRKDIKK